MEHIPNELRVIGELLRTQDNRITDQPMFIVQQERITIGFDTDYSQDDGDIVWCIEDCQYFKGDEEFEKMERAYEETGEVPQDWYRSGFTRTWEYVTACFTEEAAAQHIRMNGHNLRKPRIFADGSYRNHEFRVIRDWLMSLATIEEVNASQVTSGFDKNALFEIQNNDKISVLKLFFSDNGQLHFNGDLSEGAQLFFENIVENNSKKIAELESEIDALRATK